MISRKVLDMSATQDKSATLHPVSRGRAPFGQHQDQRSAAPWELEE